MSNNHGDIVIEAPAGYKWDEGTLTKITYVAEAGDVKYESLQKAIDAAKSKAVVTMLADTRENVTISKALTLDLNGFTLNGSTGERKAALKVDNATVTVMDSSANQTGTIKREDVEDPNVTGSNSYYVIDIQGGNGLLIFEGGNVTNTSGIVGVKGASLVRLGDDSVSARPTLTINGGTFTQDNFVAIKVDRGTLHFKGGTVNGNVASVNYDSAPGKQARIFITGGYVTGTLGTYTYNNGLVPTKETAMATVEVTGGTFDKDPMPYVVEGSTVKKNADGTFGVEKAYLAKVGDKSYYTMDEAFKAQTASGEAIVLLRDYTTGSTFNSGSINRTVDLDGHTWTYTGTDVNSAAFEINYSDVIPSRGCGQAAISTYLSVRQIWTGQWRRFRRTFRTGSGRSLTMTSRSIPQTDSISSCTGTSLRITGSIRRQRCWRQCGIPQFRTAAGHTGWKCRTSCSISTTSHIRRPKGKAHRGVMKAVGETTEQEACPVTRRR